MHKKATLENDENTAEKGVAAYGALDKVYSLEPSTSTNY